MLGVALVDGGQDIAVLGFDLLQIRFGLRFFRVVHPKLGVESIHQFGDRLVVCSAAQRTVPFVVKGQAGGGVGGFDGLVRYV